MKTAWKIAAAVYVLLILNFYHKSAGFTKYYGNYYALWKVTPVAFLAFFSFFYKGGLSFNDRLTAGWALVLGAAGDYLIGVYHEGVVPGAIVFGLGHIFYLKMFMNFRTRVWWQLAAVALIWSAIVGHVCLMPLLSVQPIGVVIMSSYSLVLTTCFVVSMSQHINGSEQQSKHGAKLRAIGFSLFFLSDSLLIFSYTDRAVPFDEIFILASYFSAQFFITYGNSVAITEFDGKPIKKQN